MTVVPRINSINNEFGKKIGWYKAKLCDTKGNRIDKMEAEG